MCGIAGFFTLNGEQNREAGTIEAMLETIKHRGPDDSNVYINKYGILGHRRLIVVDPTGGIQPMTKSLGENKFTIVYNGEIYNTNSLREELIKKGHHFNSYSDTEVILEAYIEWQEDCVKYLNGIFAFAILNERYQSIFLARDRLGVKPLFYSLIGTTLVFASEIKALLKFPGIRAEIGEKGLLELFGLGPARTLGQGIYENIFEVKPAEFLIFDGLNIEKRTYWQLKAHLHDENIGQTIEHLRYLLLDAIEGQFYADVPVCTFLSGGLDSSIISAVGAKYFKQKGLGQLNTYSVDYEDNHLYFEANKFQKSLDGYWIEKMVDAIGSVHHNVVLKNEDVYDALGASVYAQDLPGMADIDSSLYLFCKEVRKDNVVALSGECADEIFGGYPWFQNEDDLNCTTFPWSKYVHDRKQILSNKFQKLPLDEYVKSKFEDTIGEIDFCETDSAINNQIRKMTYLNLKWFMMTLLNRKDRMSMSNSLEVRVPFADHRIVEYAFNIPWHMKNLNQREKGLLRAAVKGLLPKEVIERKKNPYPKTFNPIYLKLVTERMQQILKNKNSRLLEIINYDFVKEIVETGGAAYKVPWYGQLMNGAQFLAYFIQIDTWLEAYDVKLKI